MSRDGQPMTVTHVTGVKRWPVVALSALLVVVAISGGGFVTASVLEEHDTFCVVCHLAPEVTYFNRAYIALDHPTTPVHDLATAHYRTVGDSFRCIHCHRGDSSAGHRVATVALAGRDTLTFLAGRDDPRLEKRTVSTAWLPNAACASCHAGTLLRLAGLANHFHSYLPEAAAALAAGGALTVDPGYAGDAAALRAQGLRPIAADLRCTSCHLGHTSVPGGAGQFFVEIDTAERACISCHRVAGKGPQEANLLRSE
jgi:hypothetical protein